jgi:hypothetical protein
MGQFRMYSSVVPDPEVLRVQAGLLVVDVAMAASAGKEPVLMVIDVGNAATPATPLSGRGGRKGRRGIEQDRDETRSPEQRYGQSEARALHNAKAGTA